MHEKNTPPLSPEMEQEIDENEVVYLEDLEEINDIEDADMEEIEDMDENEEQGSSKEIPERNDSICIFSGHTGYY